MVTFFVLIKARTSAKLGQHGCHFVGGVVGNVHSHRKSIFRSAQYQGGYITTALYLGQRYGQFLDHRQVDHVERRIVQPDARCRGPEFHRDS
jgi:hypothetical protein